VRELSYLRAENRELRIGAMTRQRELECSPEVANHWPLLHDATAYIGHIQIRNRGTVGGSLAHAFPSTELPIAVVTLSASMILRARGTQRAIAADKFFQSYMSTALDPGELLVEIRIPALPSGTGWSYQEVSRRHGDFALAGAAAIMNLDGSGRIAHARLTLTGATPIRAEQAEAALLGEKPAEALFRNAGERATRDLDQDSDIHASADYRRSACAVLARRALSEAAQRAKAGRA
jgi:CO/xanthine dehydrogenase FAD-binding subunit